MKQIVFFINSLSSGGAEHQLCELANGLAEKEYNITITTFGDLPDHYFLNPFIRRIRLSPNKSKASKLLSIWKYFLTIETDWVIAFGQRESKFCLLPLLLRSKNKIHVIAGERSSTIGMPAIQEFLMMYFLYKRADYIVPNSYSQRDYIVKKKSNYKKKTIVITNFTDLTKYRAFVLPNSKVIRIAIFGRYSKPKNCLRFVEAIRILTKKTTCAFIVDWYGNQKSKEGTLNSFYIEMKDKVNQYGLEANLVLNDHIKNVPEAMILYDAICLPSLWEGFSNSIGEAICCGKPCLVSNVGDNGIMVHNNVNGFLFDPNKEESIVEAFLSFFALSREERQRMGDNSRKIAEKLFNRDVFIEKYIKLIES